VDRIANTAAGIAANREVVHFGTSAIETQIVAAMLEQTVTAAATYAAP
jgi:hypothetical protein